MSRRSRRRRVAGERRWLGKAAIGLLVIGVVLFGVGYAMLRSYLHSDAFRRFLSAEASKVAGVTGEFTPFHWEGLAVDTDSFEATGKGLITGIRADDLHTEVSLDGVRRGVWEIRGSSLRRLEVSLDARNSIDEHTLSLMIPSSQKQVKRPGWYPSKAELQGLDVRELVVKANLEQGQVAATGMNVRAEQAETKNAYRAEIEGGTIRLPFSFIPELRLDRAQLRYQDKHVYLTEWKIAAWANGLLHGSGEWDMNSKRFSLQGDATGLKCDDILSPDWSKRLTGHVTSEFSFNNSSGHPQATGKLKIQNAVLTALPMLDALAAYADTRRFRVLTLNEARTDWLWENGDLSLTNLVLSSEGLARLEGSIHVRGQLLDGLFRLGLAPGTLSTIPGAETHVFSPGERGLMWTTLRISGTLEDPKEDLTDRLIEAAGIRMFEQIPETGEQVIKFTRSLLGEPPSKTIEKGVKIIEEGSKAVRGVSGVLDGLLGVGSEEKPNQKKEDQ